MSNIFDHLHIKQHTVGSSNELSFDVLDAARSDLNDKARTRKKDATGLNPTKVNSGDYGSYHGTTGTSTLSSQAEVTRRKRERKAHSHRVLAFAIVLVVALMGATTFVAYNQYQRMQTFQVKFDSVVQRFMAADQDIPAMEKFMANSTSFSHDQREELGKNLARADLVLDNIRDDHDRVASYACTDRDEAALQQVAIAADSRVQMIDSVRKTLSVAEESANEASEVNAIWNDVIDADQKARDASADANKAQTKEQTEEARKKTQEVYDLMKDALARLQSIGSSTTDIDLAPHIAYLQKRIESLEHALATGDALIAGDRENAAMENDAYNVSDKEAVELAKQLPTSVNRTAEEAFAKKVEPYKKSYESARDRAIEADSHIRQYLGS